MKNRKYVYLLLIIAVILLLVGLYQIRQNNQLVESKLYFATPDAMYLVPENRLVEKDQLYLNTIKELLVGPENSELRKTVPDGVVVNSVSLDGKLATVDFNEALIEKHWGGSSGELITIFSIVNTLTQFSEIEEVKITIAGETRETLAGHMGLDDSFEFNQEIVK